MVPVTIKFTITKENYKEILKVYKLSQLLKCKFLIKISEMNPYYYNRTNRVKTHSLLMLNSRESEIVKRQLLKIMKYETSVHKNINKLLIFSIKQMLLYIKNGNLNFIEKCNVPQYFVFISREGNIHNCLYYPSKLKVERFSKACLINKKIITDALTGKCPKCLAFHGFLQNCNLPSFKSKLN
jgi:MoaA/NifB/PqqE/SkfB family radical SAM enzyme